MSKLTKDNKFTYVHGSVYVPATPGRPAVPAHYATVYVPDSAGLPAAGTSGRMVYIPPDPVSGAPGYYIFVPD